MRKRDDNFPDNGFESWGGYMQAKISKLEDQYSSRANKNQSKLSSIFFGVSIFVNGYTKPSAEELKNLMSQHGGVYHTYQRIEDFIIASNLPDTKVKKMALGRVVRPQWITDSIAANQLLDYKNYLLYQNSRSQPKLMFYNPGAENSNLSLENTNGIKMEACNRPNDNKSVKDLEQPVLNLDNPSSLTIANKNKPADIKCTKTAANPNFINEFYSNSRLHHISQLGASFKQHVNELRENSKFEFPARKILKDKISKSNEAEPKMRFDGHKTIMHIDMDCFFVSVGLRMRPDLRGKPVAVTHSKGGQPHTKRPGVDRNAEFNLYKQKQIQKFSNATGLNENYLKRNIETRVDNITDEDDKFGSMSEIASCSYEARAKGVKNGMFMGNALRMCPDLQTIPYDFDGYKEVAITLYNTIAQYTLDIEAVSCDEMYVDCTELLKSTDIHVECFATVLRGEIKEKTGCPCSAGFGGNRLQARLATKRAKPDGQFFLYSDLVMNFMIEINLKDLPGVGRQIAQKLETLGHSTCGSLQSVSLSMLQQHLGNKTGALLFDQCRGLDPNPLSYHNLRKSVSAEVNYGIRFVNNDQCYEFIRQLAGEVNARMLQFKVIGKIVTLKLMIRAEDAPVETAKFMGHGFCNVINKSANLTRPTNEADVIFREVINILKKLKVDPVEMRGVGIQVTKLEPINNKEAKGAMNKFLSAKVTVENHQSTNTDGIKTDIKRDVSRTFFKSPRKTASPTKPISPRSNPRSPNLKNKSPVQRRKGRPPKSPRIPAASRNLLSKFIQGHSVSFFEKGLDKESEPVDDLLASEDVKKEESRGILHLDWVEVRELLRAWLDSGRAPLECDAQQIASYMREMVVTRSLNDLRVLIKFLVRKNSEISLDSWNEVCVSIVKQVQNAMMAVYGKKLHI